MDEILALHTALPHHGSGTALATVKDLILRRKGISRVLAFWGIAFLTASNDLCAGRNEARYQPPAPATNLAIYEPSASGAIFSIPTSDALDVDDIRTGCPRHHRS